MLLLDDSSLFVVVLLREVLLCVRRFVFGFVTNLLLCRINVADDDDDDDNL